MALPTKTLSYPNVQKPGSFYGGSSGASGASTASGSFTGSQPPPRQSIVQTARSLQTSGLVPKFKGIQGMGDDYYNMLADQSAKRLRQKYFDDPNSMLAQRQNELKRRGIYDSGIGASQEGEIYKSFGEEMADLQSELSTKRMEADLDTRKFNTQAEQNLLNMLLSAAGDETRAGSEYAWRTYQAQQDREKGRADSDAKLIDSLINTLSMETVDTTTRDEWEGIVGRFMQGKFGWQ